ncbi:hypothetical protein HELRODRAFT_174192 [Helobdella robusta]|uniref:HAT C-terminal dimerisation domain-containing protein n=1 Tax=Helobdella robusta TaxID=6412 RepID=T1F7R4_HELRO|nr:hypothetical protein HELRODRAFT_174192 [Helobdella robusta]ESO02776.1 hypothetical protein HELRODRAFT_174192 [Helobdella robusta]
MYWSTIIKNYKIFNKVLTSAHALSWTSEILEQFRNFSENLSADNKLKISKVNPSKKIIEFLSAKLPKYGSNNETYSLGNLSFIELEFDEFFSMSKLAVLPSEKLFSKSGNVISDRRTRLDPEYVHMIVYLQSNMHLIKLAKNVMLSDSEENKLAKKTVKSSQSFQEGKERDS